MSINGVYDLPKFIIDEKDYVGGLVWTRHPGLDGERVQLSQACDMHQRLRRDDKAVTFVKLPHGDHSMTNESSRRSILQNVQAFLEENLGAK